MLETNLKALVVVLTLALIVFALARPMLVHLMGEDNYAQRRNVWLFLTCLGFLSPSFWLYVALAAPVLLWAGQRDPNPPALFALLIFVVPRVGFDIPGGVVEKLFELSHIRLMLLLVLLPHVLRSLYAPAFRAGARLRAADWCLLSYIALNLFVMSAFQSFTDTMREAFLLVMDLGLMFYTFSRLGWNKAALTDAMASFALAGLVLAPIGLFEMAKTWLLYTGVSSQWGDPTKFAWLFRGDFLRAQASTGHSLQLGYMLATALTILLYVHGRTRHPRLALAAMVLVVGGMISTFARGPWLAAAVGLLVALALASGGAVAFIRTVAVIGVTAGLILISPIGDTVIDYLPFVGTVGDKNVEYRKLLFESSVVVIAQNPILGNPNFASQMEHLRQGQGIIDVVNGYLLAALRFGLVGMVLFAGTMLLSLWAAFRGWLLVRALDPDLRRLGGVLVGCLAGTLLFIATAGPGPITYIVSGFAASYGALATRVWAGGRRRRTELYRSAPPRPLAAAGGRAGR